MRFGISTSATTSISPADSLLRQIAAAAAAGDEARVRELTADLPAASSSGASSSASAVTVTAEERRLRRQAIRFAETSRPLREESSDEYVALDTLNSPSSEYVALDSRPVPNQENDAVNHSSSGNYASWTRPDPNEESPYMSPSELELENRSMREYAGQLSAVSQAETEERRRNGLYAPLEGGSLQASNFGELRAADTEVTNDNDHSSGSGEFQEYRPDEDTYQDIADLQEYRPTEDTYQDIADLGPAFNDTQATSSTAQTAVSSPSWENRQEAMRQNRTAADEARRQQEEQARAREQQAADQRARENAESQSRAETAREARERRDDNRKRGN